MSNRLLGLAFVVLLGAALSLSVLQYNKVFTPVAWVTLETDHTGMQLSKGADVKVAGVVVGEVRSITSQGGGARLRLAIDPKLLPQIPADATARLLPKTLFGERYVALSGTRGALKPGAVIPQDRSRSGVELQRVLDDTLPLLQAIQPDKLAATLGALATALEGRGNQLGVDIVTLDQYLDALNREMPDLKVDIQQLAGVLNTYDGALPDLLSILRDVTVTANTVVDQRQQLANFLASTTDAADVTAGFLDRHGDQIIQLGDVTRPVLELLAAYSPEYPCLLRGLVDLQPRVEQVFSGGRMHITLEVTQGNGKYEPGRDDPVYGAHDGPNCRGLPNPPIPAPQVPINDGYDYGGARAGTPKTPVGTLIPSQNPSMGTAGTQEEQNIVKPLIGAVTGALPVEVPDIAVLLWGPLLRGAVVNVP